MTSESTVKQVGVAPIRRKCGPVPGQRHSGQFKPGQSGNPSGRPKKTATMKAFEQLCREEAEAALDTIKKIMDDPSASHSARLSAAREILDRGQGKAVDRQVLLNLAGNSGDTDRILSDSELMRIAAGDDQSGTVIDLRPVDTD